MKNLNFCFSLADSITGIFKYAPLNNNLRGFFFFALFPFSYIQKLKVESFMKSTLVLNFHLWTERNSFSIRCKINNDN